MGQVQRSSAGRDPKRVDVSVVIAARNAGPFICATLESVLGQTTTEIEVVVVDDGSTDDTAKLVRRTADSRVRLIQMRNSVGVSAARNRGLSECRGPLVVFLDADDLLTPQALEKMIAVLKENPDRIACFGHHVRITEEGLPMETVPSSFRTLPSSRTLWHLLGRNFILTGTLCARTWAARATGGYRPHLRFGEDWEFWCRLASFGEFIPMETVVLKYRQRSRGANRVLRGTPRRPNLEPIVAIFSNADITCRFTSRQLRERRRKAEIDTYWSAARGELLSGNRYRFAQYIGWGIMRYPDSILQLRLIYLFLLSILKARFAEQTTTQLRARSVN